MNRIATLCIVSVLIPAIAPAQPTAQAASTAFPIVTDRPGFSDASSLVPVGHPQLEFGSTYTTYSGGRILTLGEGLFRYAVSDQLELRLSNATWASVAQGGTTDGFQDPSIGFKYRLISSSSHRPEVTFVGSTTLPAGSNNFRVNRSQPTAVIACSSAVDSATTLGGNLVASDLGTNGSRFTQYAVSLFASRTITSTVSLSYEVYGLFPEVAAGPNAGFNNIGIEYLLNPRTQLDLRVGTGFNASRDGTWIGAGVSYRF